MLLRGKLSSHSFRKNINNPSILYLILQSGPRERSAQVFCTLCFFFRFLSGFTSKSVALFLLFLYFFIFFWIWIWWRNLNSRSLKFTTIIDIYYLAWTEIWHSTRCNLFHFETYDPSIWVKSKNKKKTSWLEISTWVTKKFNYLFTLI